MMLSFWLFTHASLLAAVGAKTSGKSECYEKGVVYQENLIDEKEVSKRKMGSNNTVYDCQKRCEMERRCSYFTLSVHKEKKDMEKWCYLFGAQKNEANNDGSSAEEGPTKRNIPAGREYISGPKECKVKYKCVKPPTEEPSIINLPATHETGQNHPRLGCARGFEGNVHLECDPDSVDRIYEITNNCQKKTIIHFVCEKNLHTIENFSTSFGGKRMEGTFPDTYTRGDPQPVQCKQGWAGHIYLVCDEKNWLGNGGYTISGFCTAKSSGIHVLFAMTGLCLLGFLVNHLHQRVMARTQRQSAKQDALQTMDSLESGGKKLSVATPKTERSRTNPFQLVKSLSTLGTGISPSKQRDGTLQRILTRSPKNRTPSFEAASGLDSPVSQP